MSPTRRIALPPVLPLLCFFFLSTAASAQAPVNDVCSGAEVIPTSAVFPYLTAVTPDITSATATGDPTPSCQSSISRGVWYAFTPPTSSTYTFSTCQSSAPGSTVLDTVIAVYTSTNGCAGPFVQLTSTTGCDDNSCGLLWTGQSSLSTQLTANQTYYVVVYKNGTTAPTAGQTSVQLRVAGAPGNDLCSAAAPLTLDTALPGATAGAANDYTLPSTASACFSGPGQTTSTAPGRDAVWSFTAPDAGKYTFRLYRPDNDTSNMVMYLSSGCPSGASPVSVGTCVAAANRTTASGTSEEISCHTMQSGETLYLFADEHASSVGNQFTVEVTRCKEESEPNNQVSQANRLTCGSTGAIGAEGDVDFWDIGIAAPGYRLFALQDGVSSSSTDFDLRATTATHTLEYDDADNDTSFGGSAANLAGTPMTGVRTYLRASHWSATTLAQPYRLYAVVQPPLTEAVAEVEPNNTFANATTGAITYFSGVLAGASPSTDVDVYAFTATAGDLIVVGLDGDPLRNNTPLNAAMSLHSSDGAVLLQVNDSGSSSSTTASTTLTDKSPASPGEALMYRATSTGTYYVRVFTLSTSTTTAAGDYLLSISLNCNGSLPKPSAAQVLPASGSTVGGTQLTITGTNFVAPAAVLVGGVQATNVTVVDPTTITATTPANAAGTVDVVVFNPDAQRATITAAFTYVPPPTISNVTLNYGPEAAGNTIEVFGANFQSGATVAIGGNAATISAQTATKLTVVVPAGVLGTTTLVVTNPDGQTGSAPYSYVAPPSVTGIAPNSGRTSGGAQVTISGTGFFSGAVVLVGGNAATVSAVNATQITATVPAGIAGPADVTVTNLDGQSGTSAGLFTYVPPPSITALDPASGFTMGNTSVVISGSGFLPGATVTFGGLAAGVTFDSATQLTVTTPGRAPGPVAVKVTNTDGQFDEVVDAYTYITAGPPPEITAVTPNVGTTAGGTLVTITGSGFQEGAEVWFDTLPGLNVTFVSDTELQLTTQPRAFGPVSIRIRNPDNQELTVANAFTYDHPAAKLNSVTPSFGTTLGGTQVTLAGENFLPGLTVTVGGTPATGVSVVNSTTVNLTVPAGSSGKATIVLTNADGKTTTLADGFNYIPPPTLTAISPGNGSTLGGAAFTLTGTNFLPGATVTFGTTTANITVVDANTITGTTPSRGPGAVTVTVTNFDGQKATLSNAFTFILPPVVTAITPAAGFTAGGNLVTISGTAFTSGATVTIAGLPATNVQVVSGTKITALSPAHAAGIGDVVVTNPDGQSSTLANAFAFVPAPTLSAISVASGPAVGGMTLTLQGSEFLPGVRVRFGGVPSFVTYVSSTELTVTTPAGPPGTVDVTVYNPDTQSATLAGAWTWVAAPKITQISPRRGPETGGTEVVIDGADFVAGATVHFGSEEATAVQLASSTRLIATTPPHVGGKADVVVTNPDGQTSRLREAFLFDATPTLTAISPTVGSTHGGTMLTLTGTDFRPGVQVFVGDVPASAVVFIGAETITAVTPAHAAGEANVSVRNADGQSATLANAFTYDAAAPVLEQVLPAEGPATGGTVMTLAGANFLPGVTVHVGGALATDLELLSSSTLVVRTPAGSVGSATVLVTNPDGKNASKTNAFTYLAVQVKPETPDAGTVTEDAGTKADAGSDPTPPAEGCGCAGSSGGFSAIGLLGLALLLRRKGLTLVAKG